MENSNGKTLGNMNPRPSLSNSRPIAQNRPAAPVRQSSSARQVVQPFNKQTNTNPTISHLTSINGISRGASIPQPKVIAPVAKSVVPQPEHTNSISNFISIMRGMVGNFAILDEPVLSHNLELAGGGMSVDDRTISFECADYLMSNLAYIFMGLVLDNNFKQAFLDSLSVEFQIDKQSDEDKAKTRASMKDNKPYKSNGSIVFGVSTFTTTVEQSLMSKMQAGFTALNSYSAEFDSEVAKLSDKQKSEFGYIFSNFMYLIRAFSHNDMFMSYVVTVIEKVKAITSSKQ